MATARRVPRFSLMPLAGLLAALIGSTLGAQEPDRRPYVVEPRPLLRESTVDISRVSVADIKAAAKEPVSAERRVIDALRELRKAAAGKRGAKEAAAEEIAAEDPILTASQRTAFRVLGYASLELTDEERKALQEDFKIEDDQIITLDRRLEEPLRESVTLSTAGGPTAAIRAIGADRIWPVSQGSDVIVAVIDTGVTDRDDRFGARLLAGVNVADGRARDDAGDRLGHGTHVAGTVAASRDTGVGVAPQAKILPIRVFNDSGQATVARIETAIVEALVRDADIINLSIQVDVLNDYARGHWASSVTRATNAGAVIVLAAGNNGPGPMSLLASSPDAKQTVVVGAARNDGGPAGFTGVAPIGVDKPDVAAPGVNINSLSHDGGYALDSGTSMATPHVAGVIALALAKAADQGQDPTIESIRQALRETARDEGSRERLGQGFLQAVGFFEELTGTDVDPDGDEPDADQPRRNVSVWHVDTTTRLEKLVDKDHAKTIVKLEAMITYWEEKKELAEETE